MIAFINDHRDVYGVEPICRVLPIAPSTYYDHIAKRHHPETAAPRVQRDAILRPEVKRVFNENHAVYGAEKVWRQMQREGFNVARCTIERPSGCSTRQEGAYDRARHIRAMPA